MPWHAVVNANPVVTVNGYHQGQLRSHGRGRVTVAA
jgi:hypothetical protein